MIYIVETSKGCKRPVPSEITKRADVSIEDDFFEWAFKTKKDAEAGVIAFIEAGFDSVRRRSWL